MGTFPSPSVPSLPESTADLIAPDQRMAVLAQAFSLEMAEAEQDVDDTPWPIGQTLWFVVGASAALWAIIIAAVRLF